MSRNVGPQHVASLEVLTHCWNVASLSLFYRCRFDRCSLELAELVPLTHSPGRSTHYSNGFHDLFFIIPRCYKVVYASSFFLHRARLWNSVPIFFLLWPMIKVLCQIDICFLLTNVCKRLYENFFILFRSWVICKN